MEKIDLSKIQEFKNHPFKVKDDEQMESLVESIKENGVLNPIIVRQIEDGKFEIISGMYIFVKENVPQRQEMESRMII